jgi:hypothetical protein
MFGFIKKAVNTVGKGVGGAVKFTGNTIGKVPVVGGGLKGAFTLTVAPIKLGASLANGRRIDRAMMDNFNDQLAAAKDVAPYAQIIVSFVPGVGTAASGVIGAGIALAKGQPITKAIIEGVKGALPGGPIAQSIFNASLAVAEGEPIEQVALSAIPGMTTVQRKAISEALTITKALANGKRVDETLYKRAIAQLPSVAQKALSVGVALGHGANLQKTLIKNVKVDDVKGFGSIGFKLTNKNPVLRAGLNTLKNKKQKTGFSVGVGLLRSGVKLKPIDITAARSALPGPQKKGFDIALATQIGLKTKRRAPKVLKTAEEKFGYYMTNGISGANTKNKVAMMKTVVANPAAKKGAAKAVKDIKDNSSWWKKLLKTIGLV